MLSLSPFPLFEPGERILAVRRYIRGVCGKSWPTYRCHFTLPPVFDVGLYVTDRRIIIVMHILRLLFGQVSQWFPGTSPEKEEVIKEISIGKSWLMGSYLEIVSEAHRRYYWPWCRSRQLRMRCYMKSPDIVRDLIHIPTNEGEA